MSGADPNIQRRRLGHELRRAREAAGMTQREAAQKLEWSLSKLTRIEVGAQGVTVTDLGALLALYEVADPQQVEALKAVARASHGRTWWTGYHDIVSSQFAWLLGAESQGASLRVSDQFRIPGLLHTEAYAVAFMGAFGDPDERTQRIIRLRMERQRRFFSPEADSIFIVGEEALQRWHGGPSVMREQLEHLLAMGQQAGVTIRIVPFSAGSHGGLGSPFTLVRLKESEEEVLYIESVTGDLLARDEPDRLAKYTEYFETMRGLALSKEDGEALLRERIDILHRAEQSENAQSTG